jgi:hypothetical protein
MITLSPNSLEAVDLSVKRVEVPKCNLILESWHGTPIRDTYNNKAVIDFEGHPLFAELAILKMLEKDGWSGVWVDSYRNKYRVGLPEDVAPIGLPLEQRKIIERIREKVGRRGGCWDVFAWKGDKIRFIEQLLAGIYHI